LLFVHSLAVLSLALFGDQRAILQAVLYNKKI